MRYPRISLIGVIVATFLLSSGVAQASSLGHVFPAIDSAASIPNYSQTASRNDYVILQAWETGKLKSLKAANPQVKVLVYKNLGFSTQLPSSHNGPSPSGVLYSEAPDSWFLKDKSSGQRFASWGFEWLWAMDVGLPEYQKKWAENVIAECKSAGWDGVFLDDANATMKYHHSVDQVAKYPSDATYSAAMGSALAYIGPKIRAAGKLAVPNFAAWVEAPNVYNSWLQYVDGALDEMFLKWGGGEGEGYRGEAQWNLQLQEIKYAASQGKDFLAFTHGATGETKAARYGYGTVLLGSEGNASYAFTPQYATETWLPEYDYQLGATQGTESRDSNGVHRRVFANGLVLVNPTTSSQAVSFNGTYSGSGLANATKATMPAQSALILKGNAPAPTPTPEPTPTPTPEPTPTPTPEPTPTPTPEPTPTPAPEPAPTPTPEPTPTPTPAPEPATEPTPAPLPTEPQLPPTTSDPTPTKPVKSTGSGRSRSKGGKRSISVSFAVNARGVKLRWSRAAARVKAYRVIRDGRLLATTRGRSKADNGLRQGRVYRYKVQALNRSGAVLAVSPTLRVPLS